MFKQGDLIDYNDTRWVVLDHFDGKVLCLEYQIKKHSPFNRDDRVFKDHFTRADFNRAPVSNNWEGCSIQKILAETDKRLSLLTLEQFKRYKKWIPKTLDSWWLKTAGDFSFVWAVRPDNELEKVEAYSYFVGIRSVIEIREEDCQVASSPLEATRCKESGKYITDKNNRDWIILGERGERFMCLSLFAIYTSGFNETASSISKWHISGLRKHLNQEFSDYPEIEHMNHLTSGFSMQCKDRVFLLDAETYEEFKDVIMPLHGSWWLSTLGKYREDNVMCINENNAKEEQQCSSSLGVRPVVWIKKCDVTFNQITYRVLDIVNGYKLCIMDNVLMLKSNSYRPLPKGKVWDMSDYFLNVRSWVQWYIDNKALVFDMVVPEFMKYRDKIPEVPHAWWLSVFKRDERVLHTCVVPSQKAVSNGMVYSKMNGFRPAFFIENNKSETEAEKEQDNSVMQQMDAF